MHAARQSQTREIHTLAGDVRERPPAYTASGTKRFCALIPMSPRFLVLALGFMLTALVGNNADAAAQMCGTLPAGPNEPVMGRILPIVEVRGEVPYVEYRGQKVRISPNTMKLFHKEIIPHDPMIPPHWVFAANLRAEQHELRFYDAPGGPFNKELLCSVDLESPVTLDNVWIVMSIASERGGSGNIIQEIGTLHAYKSRSISIHRKLDVELGETRFFWHVFARDREILHSLMGSGVLEDELTRNVAAARAHARNMVAEPYLTFLPRLPSHAKGCLVLTVDIGRNGKIKNASVVNGNGTKIEKSLVEAARHWWFLPKMVDGKNVSETMTLTVDLNQREKWSNACVQPVSIPSK